LTQETIELVFEIYGLWYSVDDESFDVLEKIAKSKLMRTKPLKELFRLSLKSELEIYSYLEDTYLN